MAKRMGSPAPTPAKVITTGHRNVDVCGYHVEVSVRVTGDFPKNPEHIKNAVLRDVDRLVKALNGQ